MSVPKGQAVTTNAKKSPVNSSLPSSPAAVSCRRNSRKVSRETRLRSIVTPSIVWAVGLVPLLLLILVRAIRHGPAKLPFIRPFRNLIVFIRGAAVGQDGVHAALNFAGRCAFRPPFECTLAPHRQIDPSRRAGRAGQGAQCHRGVAILEGRFVSASHVCAGAAILNPHFLLWFK